MRLFLTLLSLVILPALSFGQVNEALREKQRESKAPIVLQPFESFTPPPAPDYSKVSSWSCFPGKRSSSDKLPHRLPEAQKGRADLGVDVFYVYPTVLRTGKYWNADIANKSLNNLIDAFPVKYQASVFNHACRVFAPRYRQAAIYAFVDSTGKGRKALDFALADVVRAFDYYIANHNQGRPFILAGHSQGSYHLLRLLREHLDKSPVKNRLIAAYLIGLPTKAGWVETVPFCESPEQTGCWFTYNTFSDKTPTDHGSIKFFQQRKTLNPLSFRADTVVVGAKQSLGYTTLMFNYRPAPADLKVFCRSGIVLLHSDKIKNPKFLGKEDYHALDYNLFYSNLRANVLRRIDTWQKNQTRVSSPTGSQE
jgi:hypothetical protein